MTISKRKPNAILYNDSINLLLNLVDIDLQSEIADPTTENLRPKLQFRTINKAVFKLLSR